MTEVIKRICAIYLTFIFGVLILCWFGRSPLFLTVFLIIPILLGYLDLRRNFEIWAIVVRGVATVIIVIGCMDILWNTCSQFVKEGMFLGVIGIPIIAGIASEQLLKSKGLRQIK